MVVVSSSSTVYGHVEGGQSVGEMGFLTGRNRSATVRTTEESVALTLTRDEFDAVMLDYPGMLTSILKSVVELLSERLVSANLLIDDYSLNSGRPGT